VPTITLSPRARQVALVAHVVSSVGWLGAVAAFLVLSVVGLNTDGLVLLRACYVAMDVLGRFLIVPLSIAAFATGVFQSLATSWGLFGHYWVVAKFILTIGATALLLLHQYTAVAGAAALVSGAADAAPDPEVLRLGRQLIFDASLAIVVLIGTTVLSIVKPWGPIRHGARAGAWYAGLALLMALAAFVIVHLVRGGAGSHGH